jgi:hypothetical protein
MKKINFLIFLLVVSFSVSKAVELEGGIFHSGSVLQIKMKPTGGSFNSGISAAQFAIKCLTTYAVSFGSPSNPTGITFAYQQTKTSGSYTYNFYSWSGTAVTANWSENSENLVMEVTISGGIGEGDFFLVSGEELIAGSDPNWYVESAAGLTGGTSVELYQASTPAVPLPVELSSFTAKTNHNVVNLNWQTKTEVNNYGFEVERASSMTSPIQGWEKIGFVPGHGNSNSPKDYSLTDKNPSGGSKFIYRLKQIDNDGKFEYSKEVEVELVPNEFALYQNYPNPFNPATNIQFSLPKAARINLSVYNLLGEKIATLLNEDKEAGFYNVQFDASKLSSGVYIYRLTTGDFIKTMKMNFIK